MSTSKWIGVVVIAVACALLAAYQLLLRDLVGVYTGGAAKLMCSAVFAAGRDPDLVRQQEFQRRTSPGRYLSLASLEVDLQAREVTATLFGLGERLAVFRDGLGCTATEGISAAELRAQGDAGALDAAPVDPTALWPEGEATLVDRLPGHVDARALEQAVDRAFAEVEPQRPRNTRALVVVHRGRIVAERYAEGFGPSTGHLSNSMAKTVIGALVGVLVRQGRLDVHDRAPIEEWSNPSDQRHAITLDDLLRMRSGLSFDENYTNLRSDITMMYVGGDLAGFAASKPLEASPGTVWKYSTGTSNILGRIVSENAGSTWAERLSFPRRELFEPLGMRYTVLEVDGSGSFVGGSSVFASARDFARFGLLYLNDGMWNGQRILPEGWVDYTLTPTPGVPPGYSYGAQVWLNDNADVSERRWPALPADTFVMRGHQQQYVAVVPSRELIVVRLGLTESADWTLQSVVADVIGALRPADDWPTESWGETDAGSSGLDPAPLETFDREIAAGEHGYVDGLLVVRGGRVAFEREYRHDYTALFESQAQQTRGPYNYYDPDWHPYYRQSALHTMQSVSKSVTSALIGIAIGRGELPGVDVAVERYFPEHPAADHDPRREALTLEHLLTMTAGIAWDESTVTYTDPRNSCAAMESSVDWIAYVRAQPMTSAPGTTFVYNSGVTMLLAHILHQATGMHLTEYAEQHLFGPLGIDDYYWKRTPTGLPDAEGGLYLRPRDLAKIGYLYLHDGVWEGRRVLPEDWVQASTAPRLDTGTVGWKYGYQWWLLPYAGRYAYTALGYGGQRLLVLPDLDIVAVATGWNLYDKPQLPADLVLERVLDAAR